MSAVGSINAMTYFKTIIRDNNANASIIFAGSILALLLGVGLSTDTLASYNARNNMQDALDSAVLAAAINAEPDEYTQVGTDAFNNNLRDDRLADINLNFDENNDMLNGQASATLPLFFADILPANMVTINVSSRVNISTPRQTPCIVALSSTASPGILINGGADINAEGCALHAHSQANPAVTLNSITRINIDNFCIAGSNIFDNTNGVLGDKLERNCNVAPDPFAGTIPIPNTDCTVNSRVYDAPVVNLNPGVYCGGFNFQPSTNRVNLAPGLYVIKDGSWNMNGGRVEGSSVTFYYDDSESVVQFNADIQANLSAPLTGDYANMFITERPGLEPGDFVIFDENGFDFEGAVYLPSKDVTINGGSTIRARNLQFVVSSLILNSAVLNIETPEGQNTRSATIYISK